VQTTGSTVSIIVFPCREPNTRVSWPSLSWPTQI